jgi:hypothetical protein
MGKDLEGSGRGITQIRFRHLFARTEENTKNFRQNSQCPSRDSNRTSPEYKPRVLPVDPTFSVRNIRSL